MPTYTLQKSFDSHAPLSPNVRAVAEMFGLGADHTRKYMVIEPLQITIEPGHIAYITGASGSGKSLLLKLLKEKMPDHLDLNAQPLPQGTPLVDCFDGDLDQAFNCLGLAGLSDVFEILRCPEQLSDGQRYRFRLALALAKKPKVIFIDEFCAALDRVTAAVVAYNVRRSADMYDTTFIVATSHEDLMEDLQPDIVVVKHYGGKSDIFYPER